MDFLNNMFIKGNQRTAGSESHRTIDIWLAILFHNYINYYLKNSENLNQQ